MTRRPKVVGFVRGDFDPAFPLDDKMQLLRATTDTLHYHAAVSVYWHVVAAAWRRPERVPADRTCPEAPEQIADLVRVGLLDKAGRLPVPSFNGWIGRAVASRASSTDRKRRNRSGMSRGTDVGQTVTARGTREGGSDVLLTTTTSTEETVVEGGPGGTNAYMPDGDRDALDTYHELTGYRPWGEFSGDGLKAAIRDYTDAATDAAIRAEYAKDGDRNTLLKRTLARLARDADRSRRAPDPAPRRKPIDENARRDALRVLVGGGDAP